MRSAQRRQRFGRQPGARPAHPHRHAGAHVPGGPRRPAAQCGADHAQARGPRARAAAPGAPVPGALPAQRAPRCSEKALAASADVGFSWVSGYDWMVPAAPRPAHAGAGTACSCLSVHVFEGPATCCSTWAPTVPDVLQSAVLQPSSEGYNLDCRGMGMAAGAWDSGKLALLRRGLGKMHAGACSTHG